MKLITWKQFAREMKKSKGLEKDNVEYWIKSNKNLLFKKVVQLSANKFIIGIGCFTVVEFDRKARKVDYDYWFLNLELEPIERLSASNLLILKQLVNGIRKNHWNSKEIYNAIEKLDAMISEK